MKRNIGLSQRRSAKEALQVEILKGIGSGKATPMTDKDWYTLRAEVVKRHAERKKHIQTP